MGIFDRRKDAKPGLQPEDEGRDEQPTAPSSGPMPVASEIKEQRIRDEPKVAAAPPAPPKPPAEPAHSAAAVPPAPVTESAKAEPATQIHTVADGETLADLATTYGVAAEEIARQNHLPPGGRIHPGQVFVISS